MKVVFVHGACVTDGAWWWHRMAAPPADLDLRSHAVELPSCGSGPADDLGDMYADADQPNVAHLVYLDAVMPDQDQTHASFGGPEPPPWMEPRDDGTIGIRTEQPELLHALFLHDCDQEIRELHSGHHPFLSQPDLLAHLLAEVARTTASGEP